jgi:hypothetical protein
MPMFAEPQAYDIPSFCRAYSISRSFAYLEIKSGRLKPFKAGRRTLISREAADNWRHALEAATESRAVVTHSRTPGF